MFFQEFLASFPVSSMASSWNKQFLTHGILLFLFAAASSSNSMESDERSSRESRDLYYSGFTPSPITRIHRISNGRLNSRFLTTIPSMEFLQMARREGQLMPAENAHVPASIYHRQYSRHVGNSPVFYIRLPPAPYMFVPGLGYVSPHPYNTPMIPPNPVMMNPLGMMMANGGGGGGGGMDDEDLSSSENMQNNVISLPLKFLSNGRPAQIQNPKRKHQKHKPDSSKTTHLISGGKYSFNGRPNGVFIVNSPMDPHHSNSIL